VVRIAEGKVSLSTLGRCMTCGREREGVGYFVWAMAVISINLGLINLLPIPVLDGGHLLFLFFEGLLRRPLPLRVREIASLVGMLALIFMMGIAFKNDIERRWDVIQGQEGAHCVATSDGPPDARARAARVLARVREDKPLRRCSTTSCVASRLCGSTRRRVAYGVLRTRLEAHVQGSRSTAGSSSRWRAHLLMGVYSLASRSHPVFAAVSRP
jgi:hypothetical protein